MATGADLGIIECFWRGCDLKALELVESANGVIFACCPGHAQIERGIAHKERMKRYG